MSESSLQTPLQKLRHWEQHAPERIYLRQPVDRQWREFSWREVGEQARRLTAALRGFGLRPGDRVGIFSKNCAEWIIADLAVMLGGFVSVPIYSTANAQTLRYVLEHSEARALFVGKLDQTEDLGPAIPSGCVSIGFPYPTAPTEHAWAELLGAHAPTGDPADPSLDDVMTILYTSGSTGNPKGAVHTYRSFAYAGTHLAPLLGCDEQTRILSYLPLAHCTERAYVEAPSLYHALQVSFSESLATFFDDLKSVRPTLFGSVPRLWKRFQLGVLQMMPQAQLDQALANPQMAEAVRHKIAQGLGLDASTWNGSGAAPMAPALLEWWQSVGLPICEGWGMTETFAFGSQTLPGQEIRIGTIGKAYPDTELVTSDEGELLIKSPTMMREYYKEPEKTAASFTEDGFFRTGDRAEIDADGYIKITGRVKEIFKTAKGKYVAPVPIESQLAQGGLVEQVCVVGIGRKQPVALVQVVEGHGLDQAAVGQALAALMMQVNEGLESHERLDRIIVIDQPWTPGNGLLTPTLKIKRHLVEAKYQALIARDDEARVEFEADG
ncbi:MAG: AMP-binding protein [Myxococcota bacterium]